MKKTSILFLVFTLNFSGLFAQETYQNGYYVDNNGQKNEVLINNLDWKNNPKDFSFKVNGSSDSEKKEISEVVEFGIGKELKFVRAVVEIDKSSNLDSFLSSTRNPDNVSETLFLKVLVEGKAVLYQYEEKNLIRFFYSLDGSDPKQLVHKRYQTPQGIAENKLYVNQLKTELNYSVLSEEDLGKVRYQANSLKDYFVKYNTHYNSTPTIFSKTKTQKPFHLYVRSGLIFSNFSVEKVSPNQVLYPFENPVGLHTGLQLEYLLPYRHQSWALLFEVNYQNLSSVGTENPETRVLDFRAIEFPLGVKYYFLNRKWGKLYANTAFVITKNLDSSIQVDNFNIELTKNHRFLNFGLGVSLNRLQIEYRRDVPRNLDYFYPNWKAMINNNYIMVGFKLF
jgi:hypothetical protein